MEKNDELKGKGNTYDFGARIYDPRAARWLSLDPLMDKFPDVAGYVSFIDNPILFVDPDGRDIKGYDEESERELVKDLNAPFGSESQLFYIKQNTFLGISWLWDTDRTLELNEKLYDKMLTNRELTPEMYEVIGGVKELIDSDKEFIVAYADEGLTKNVEIDFSYFRPVYLDDPNNPTKSLKMNHNRTLATKENEKTKWKTITGITVTDNSPKNIRNTSKAYILINQYNSQDVQFEAIGGGLTTPYRPAIVFHELLDEGLFWKNDPYSEIGRTSNFQSVYYQNNILKMTGNKLRNGNDHR